MILTLLRIVPCIINTLPKAKRDKRQRITNTTKVSINHNQTKQIKQNLSSFNQDLRYQVISLNSR